VGEDRGKKRLATNLRPADISSTSTHSFTPHPAGLKKPDGSGLDSHDTKNQNIPTTLCHTNPKYSYFYAVIKTMLWPPPAPELII